MELFTDKPLYWLGVSLGFCFAINSAVYNAIAAYLLKEGGLDWRHVICYFSIGIAIISICLSFVSNKPNRLLTSEIVNIAPYTWMLLAVMIALQVTKSGNQTYMK